MLNPNLGVREDSDEEENEGMDDDEKDIVGRVFYSPV
jgi:hypothetical protein